MQLQQWTCVSFNPGLSLVDTLHDVEAALAALGGNCSWHPSTTSLPVVDGRCRRHKKNEVFLDVVESVNLLVNSNGTLVLSEASDPASTPTAVCCVLRVSGSELLMFRPLPHVLVMYTQRSVHNGSPCK